MLGYSSTFLQKFPGFSDNEWHSIGIVSRKYADYAINPDTVAPTFRALPEHFRLSAGWDTNLSSPIDLELGSSRPPDRASQRGGRWWGKWRT